MTDHKKTIGNYEPFAKTYAKDVDEKAIHQYYERPHTLSLLPEKTNGLKILDLGCGSGWYAEHLIGLGAEVTAVDISETMVNLTAQRILNKGRCVVANLEETLPFTDGEFDLILAPLVIHYIEDWQSMFQELSRTLKPSGALIFSTHSMHTESALFDLKSYHETQQITDHWSGIGEVQFYHHSLSELSSALYHAEFLLERILEPGPPPQIQQYDKKLYNLMTKHPWFMFVKAIKK